MIEQLSIQTPSRRGFLKSLLTGAVGCAILPSAATYLRRWHVQEQARRDALQRIEKFWNEPIAFKATAWKTFLVEDPLTGLVYMKTEKIECWLEGKEYHTVVNERLEVVSATASGESPIKRLLL